VVTLELTAACLTVGLVCGLLLALLRMGRSRVLRNLAAAYIEVLRATPVIVLLFLAYFGLAQMGLTLPAFVSVVVTLGAFYAALYCEVYRSGVESVPRGQWEAAEALGLRRGQVLRLVVLPQALLAILPPATSRAADVLKDTSLVVTISGVSEIMYQAYGAATATFAPMSMFVLAAAFYFPLYLILSRVVRGWEVRHAARR
jgi:His/Glu/Gln/Arg/opine family amino acid ABC transporter permease subunit